MRSFEKLHSDCVNAFNVIESEMLIAQWVKARLNEAIHINLRVNGGNDSPFTNKLLESEQAISYIARQLESELTETAIK